MDLIEVGTVSLDWVVGSNLERFSDVDGDEEVFETGALALLRKDM